ncbi:activator of Hsp90 ATPase [Myxozyma melibiosi]|uniref:Activator of Hsp90 ATPase n=1 Tax=Myxozyma melibiosi TaxID=54550 RepID=A0ABR1F5N2_9ASCO
MVLHNPNNWHWVDKNCVEWSKTYFKEKLVGTTASDSTSTATITSLNSLTGDVDVNQRKGKVISLFDVKIVVDFEGKVGDEEVKGTISVPEVAYDTEEDEYVFDISITGETREKMPMRAFVRDHLVPLLRTKLAAFGPDLIEVHGKDIQHPVTENKSVFTASNQTAKPITRPSTSSSSSSSAQKSSSAAYNTTTLRLDPVFNTSAAELYTTFLDPGRVSAWTRSPPVKFAPEKGGEYALFGGNVSGKFLELVENKSIEMSWRLKDWKPEHFANLKIVFDQGQGETKAVVTWKGVPVGQEDVTKHNFEEYYVKSIKMTFGFGAVL